MIQQSRSVPVIDFHGLTFWIVLDNEGAVWPSNKAVPLYDTTVTAEATDSIL
jgi:hypothetical protein